MQITLVLDELVTSPQVLGPWVVDYDCGNIYEDLSDMTVLENFVTDVFGIKGKISDYENFLTDDEIINTIGKMLKKKTNYANTELVNKLIEIEAEQMFY